MSEVTREAMIDALRRSLNWGISREDLPALRAILREIEAGGWRPISEAPPEHKLLFLCDNDVVAGVFSGSHAALEQTGATHWMLAPSPRTTSDGGK